MGEINITVDSNDLHDPSEGRSLFGDINIVERIGQSLIATVKVIITGTDTDDLHTNWDTAKTKFSKLNAAVDITLDDGEASYMEQISPSDGRHAGVTCSIMMDPSGDHTDTSLECVFEVVAESIEATPDGLVDDVILTVQYNEGGVQTRNISGRVIATSGNTAEDNWNTVKGTLFSTYLLTDSNGSRSSSSGQAIVDRDIRRDTDNDELTFSVTSKYMEIDLSGISDGGRRIELQVDTSTPDDFHEDGGVRPTLVEVAGSISADLGTYTVTNDTWETVKSDILAQVKSKSGKSSLELIQIRVSVSESNNTMSFAAQYIADNLENFSYRMTTSEVESASYAKWIDGDGYHRIQEDPGPRNAQLTISVNRHGPGIVDIEPLLPFRGLTDPNQAYTYKLIRQNLNEDGPREVGDVQDFYTQTGVFIYDRLRPSPFIGSNFLRRGIQ